MFGWSRCCTPTLPKFLGSEREWRRGCVNCFFSPMIVFERDGGQKIFTISTICVFSIVKFNCDLLSFDIELVFLHLSYFLRTGGKWAILLLEFYLEFYCPTKG